MTAWDCLCTWVGYRIQHKDCPVHPVEWKASDEPFVIPDGADNTAHSDDHEHVYRCQDCGEIDATAFGRGYDEGWNDALIAVESSWRASDGDFDFAIWKLRNGDERR